MANEKIGLINKTTGVGIADADTRYLQTSLARTMPTVLVSGGPYNLTTSYELYMCSGSFTVNLPSATGSGRQYNIKPLSGTITVAPSGADTIDGVATSQLLSGVAGFQPTITLVDGLSSAWYII